jgi:hypothetical protein
MKKFDLKKFIAENKATFYSSLSEDLYEEVITKGEALEYAESWEDEGILNDFNQSFADKEDITKQEFFDFFEQHIDDISELKYIRAAWRKLSSGEGLDENKKYYKDAEADDAKHIKALEKDMKDDKKSGKMKMSELKAKIKEMVLSEMTLDVDNMEDAPESEEDFLAEVDAILAEADKEEVDDTEVEFNDEETIDTTTTTEVDPDVKAVQDALTQAQAAAQKLGDPKLTDQIGNTITFFTRTHVVEKGAVAEDLN